MRFLSLDDFFFNSGQLDNTGSPADEDPQMVTHFII